MKLTWITAAVFAVIGCDATIPNGTNDNNGSTAGGSTASGGNEGSSSSAPSGGSSYAGGGAGSGYSGGEEGEEEGEEGDDEGGGTSGTGTSTGTGTGTGTSGGTGSGGGGTGTGTGGTGTGTGGTATGCNTANEACGPGKCGGSGGSMLPGANCMSCHGGSFSAAGTVFADSFGGSAAGGVTVHVTDSKGTVATMKSNGVGNFYTSQALVPPLHVELQTANGTIAMVGPAPSGACNQCHTCGGAAGGKLYEP